MYRHYLAMILAVDHMLGRLLDYLDEHNLSDNTIVVFASDHGTQGGSQGVNPWSKKNPYDASIRVPGIVRYPGRIAAGSRHQGIMNMVDWFPTLCGLAGLPVPRTVEGTDHAAALLAPQQPMRHGVDNSMDSSMDSRMDSSMDSAFIMNFSKWFDWFQDGAEWRGVRTQQHSYAQWLNGKVELYDLQQDPLQMDNLAGRHPRLQAQLQEILHVHQQRRGDELVACTDWKHWLDEQRRVVRNAYGPLSHPESAPDWSLIQ